MANTICFRGKTYPAREIEIPDYGAVLISTSSLNDALMNDDHSDFVSDEARTIDEQIYYFVEDSEIGLGDVTLAKLLIAQTL
jgi:hypothetical protein